MLLYCPRCQAPTQSADRCPTCGGRTVTPAEAHASAPDLHAPPPELLRPTPAGRLVVGVVAGLGLYFGLREWAAAGLVVAEESWKSPGGVAVAGSLKVLAAGVAGVLAATGRPKGASAGLTAGLVVGGLLLAADRLAGGRLDLTDLATAVGLATAAAAGGAVGCRRWPAPVDLPVPPAPQGSSLAGMLAKTTQGPSERPLRWYRVFAGGMVAAAGIALADPGRDLFKRGSVGSFGPGGASMTTVVDLEIAALFVMFGGAIAGATTGVGARHGVLAGVVGGLATVWMPAAGVRSVEPVVSGLLKVLGLPTNDLGGWGAALNLFLAVLAVAGFGGWLGGALMPPVLRKGQVKARLAYT